MRLSNKSLQRVLMAANIAIVVVTVIFGVVPQPAFAQTTLIVDDDGQAAAGDCDAALGAFDSIQDAVDAATSGDTIYICPGIYDEQVVVTTHDLTLLGSGAGYTFLRPSDVEVNTTGALDPFPVAPILLVDDATGVTVKDLTVDGSLAYGGSAIGPNCLNVGYFIGIFYRHSSGTIDETHVTNIRSSTVCSSGATAGSNFESASNLVIKNSIFDNYGSLGVNCVGPNTVCNVTGNTFQGLGPVDDQLQAGIILRLGAGGIISGNTIIGHFFSTRGGGIGYKSVGIALFAAEPGTNPHLHQTNYFSENQLNIQRQATAEVFE